MPPVFAFLITICCSRLACHGRRFFGGMEMRGFAQRSHERKELGAKSHAFSGWKGPPKITKNEVHLLRFAPALPAQRMSSRAHLEGRAGPSARPISCQYHWGSACMAFLREASGRSFVTRAKTIRLNERFEATCACVFLSFYFTSPLLLRIPCDYIRCLLSHPAPLSCP